MKNKKKVFFYVESTKSKSIWSHPHSIKKLWIFWQYVQCTCTVHWSNINYWKIGKKVSEFTKLLYPFIIIENCCLLHYVQNEMNKRQNCRKYSCHMRSEKQVVPMYWLEFLIQQRCRNQKTQQNLLKAPLHATIPSPYHLSFLVLKIIKSCTFWHVP